MSLTNDQIVTVLENVLFESPTLAAANAQLISMPPPPLAAGTVPPATPLDLALNLVASPEIGIAEEVVRYYEGVLGRDPNGAEVAYYTGIAEAGLTPAQIAQGSGAVSGVVWNQIATYFTASPEFTAHTAGDTPASLVQHFYGSMLGRAGADSEVSYYVNLLNQGTSVSTIAQYFVNSPEYQNKANASIANNLAYYGADVATGGASRTDSVIGHVPQLTVGTAGASYASSPNTVLYGGKAGTTIALADHSALTVDPQTTLSDLPNTVTNVAEAIAFVESKIGAHHVASLSLYGNTYVVESMTGTPGPTDTTVIELAGLHALAPSAGSGVLTLLF